MWSKKEIVIFCAGAQAFHTLSHIIISMTGTLPIHVFGMIVTQQFNLYAIIINAVVTVGLLWWSSKLR